MSTQISPQIKIVAAVGLVLALVLGASMTLMGHSSSSNSAEPAATTTQSAPTATAPTASTPAASATSHTSVPHSAAKPATHAKATAKPKATTASKAAAKPAVKAKPVPLIAANGLPGVLDQLLHIHDIVVVALWDPEIPSDRISLNEAEAGAKDANVGFIAVNVLDDRVAGPLTAAAGNGTLLPSPGVLVYKRPAMLMNTIRGFADRVAVAEAVANAMLTDTPPAAATSTSSTTPTTDPSIAAAAAAATTTP